MTLKNEELLSKYFERKMTSSEEQNFLISVAANDELRLAFRSQLELMRAVSNDKDGIRSAAQVRARTLAALGLSTLAADSFLEHDLMSRPAKQTATEGVKEEAKREITMHSASAQNGFMNFIKSPVTTIVGGLAVGFLAAVAIFSNPEPEISRPAQQQIVAPQTTQVPANQTPDLRTPQTAQEQPVLDQPRSIKLKPRTTATRKPEGETITPNSGLNSKVDGTQENQVVNRSEPGKFSVAKPNIKKPSNSTAKQ
jgi:hypothetical protein